MLGCHREDQRSTLTVGLTGVAGDGGQHQGASRLPAEISGLVAGDYYAALGVAQAVGQNDPQPVIADGRFTDYAAGHPGPGAISSRSSALSKPPSRCARVVGPHRRGDRWGTRARVLHVNAEEGARNACSGPTVAPVGQADVSVPIPNPTTSGAGLPSRSSALLRHVRIIRGHGRNPRSGRLGSDRCPTRAHEDVAPSVAPGSGTADVARHRCPFVEGNGEHVVRVDVLREAVYHGLILGLEGAEQPVPDDEDPAVVSIEVHRVGSVVDTVVARRVEHRLERPEPIDHLGVEPELVQLTSTAPATRSPPRRPPSKPGLGLATSWNTARFSGGCWTMRNRSRRDDNSVESWRIVEPVIDAWQQGQVPLHEYRAGTAGPESWSELP